MGELGGEDAIGALIVALKDEDKTVRVVAIKAVGRLDVESATGSLLEALREKRMLQGLSKA